MTLKPPTRTLPKVVMKEWPERDEHSRWAAKFEEDLIDVLLADKPLSDFTRVVEETGVLDQKETQRRKQESKHD
ncbi:hypothetical protein [Afipia clevelandensis]|uniref:Uncharacterized protein n=1 Tax=Afipia clevelandensis ATCC 49720 TaxID=883079 RepID=K8P8C8_9BRAD|nr:hypothetical protein [Afipia clevelandensis]EKS37741.1 hypothetical protein HMPREF9696_01691 [Afipia clevelandensis ATCC 49720]